MKIVLYIFPLILFVFFGCSVTNQSKKNISNNEKEHEFTVFKVDSVNNYYLIYAEKEDTLYKIISQKDKLIDCNNRKVRTNRKYNFKLYSVWNQDLYINGVNVGLNQTPRVNCIEYEDNTIICLEKDSINDLHQAKNLKGLCIIEE